MFSLVMAVCVIVGAGEVVVGIVVGIVAGIVVGEGLVQIHSELASTSHEPPLAVLKYTVVVKAYTKHPSG